jgi:hypothetical protein
VTVDRRQLVRRLPGFLLVLVGLVVALICTPGTARADTVYHFAYTGTPPTSAAADSEHYTFGAEFVATDDVSLTAIRYYRPADSGTCSRDGALYKVSDQSVVAETAAAAPTGTGWQELAFPEPVALTVGTHYMAAFQSSCGYVATPSYFDNSAADLVSGPLTLVQPVRGDTVSGDQESFVTGDGLAYPTGAFNSTNYWVDVTAVVSEPEPSPSPSVSPSPTPSPSVPDGSGGGPSGDVTIAALGPDLTQAVQVGFAGICLCVAGVTVLVVRSFRG